MKAALMASAATIATLCYGAEIRTLEDTVMVRDDISIRLSNLTLTKASLGKPNRLAGVMTNDSSQDNVEIHVRLNPTDATGRRPAYDSPLYVPRLQHGESRGFYYDLNGKWDFPTLRYDPSLEVSYPPKYRVVLSSPKGGQDLAFSDEFYDFAFAITEKTFALVIQNKSQDPLSINWNESSFVDYSGSASPIAPGETRFMDMNSVKPPSIVPGGSRLQSIIIPTRSAKMGTAGVEIAPLLPACPECRSVYGRELQLLLSVRRGSEAGNYAFKFTIQEK